MKIYVKETSSLSVRAILPIINSAIEVLPLSRIEDVSCNDMIFLSEHDTLPLAEPSKYHVVEYESFFERLSLYINQIYCYNRDYFFLKNALKCAENQNITTLVSGSSYGTFGIDLSYINNAINLSSISQDLYYSQKLILEVCKKNKNIENIVLCVGYYCFYSDLSLSKSQEELRRLSKVYYPLLHDAHNCLILPPKEDFCIQSDIIKTETILDAYAYSEYEKGYFNETFPRAQLATKEWDDKNKKWGELSNQEQEEAGRRRAQSHNKSKRYLASFYENIDLFQDFVDFCNSNDINLLVTVVPATEYYLKYLDSEFKENFYSALESIKGTLHLLDLSEDNNFKKDIDFNDPDHLNDCGAAVLSSIINSVLQDV